MILHQVVGGRLYLFNTDAPDPISEAELKWAGQEAARLPAPSFRWTVDRVGPARPPIGVKVQAFVPGHPAPQDLYRLPQSDRQEQLLRIQHAKSLFEQPPQRFLGSNGTVWVVDGQRLFVRDNDHALQEAIQGRLAQGNLQGRPPAPPQPSPMGRTRLSRVLPVGDTR